MRSALRTTAILIPVLIAGAFDSIGRAQNFEFQAIPGQRVLTGRMIVRPVSVDEWIARGLGKDQATRAHQRAVQAIEAYPVAEHVLATDDFLLTLPPGLTEETLARVLLTRGDVAYAEPDWRLYPVHDGENCTDDPHFLEQWALADDELQACRAWEIEAGSPQVVVAVCDTGLRTSHEDLLENRREGYDAIARLWESQGGSIDPVNPHGTQVTGCVAATGGNGKGICGVGRSLAHRMLRVSDDATGSALLSTLQHAARTAAETGDRVVSISYSGVDSASNLTTATYVRELGGLLCWAAGNDRRRLEFGARDEDELIVVGATDRNGALADFSAFGPFVDLVAPGVDVLTTDASGDSAYTTVSGTSFATPLVAGICALLWSAEPSLPPAEVEALLLRGCVDLGRPGADDAFGAGRADAFATLSLDRLDVRLPHGVPTELELRGGTILDVHLEPHGSVPVAAGAILHVVDGGLSRDVPGEWLSDQDLRLTFPALPHTECADPVAFHLSVWTQDGIEHLWPPGAPSHVAASLAAHEFARSTVLADLDFEDAEGWSVENVDLKDGAFELGVPVGGGDRGDPATDFDGSGRCWLTGNRDGNSDVDGGPTRLSSPDFDLRGFDQVVLTTAEWLWSDTDTLVVEWSGDGGDHFKPLDVVTPGVDWRTPRRLLRAKVPFSSQVRLRYSVADNPNDSLTEAALDAFQLRGVQCPPVFDLTPAELSSGEEVEFSVWSGLAGSPVSLYVVAVNESPLWARLDQGRLDSNGRWQRRATLPDDPALRGLHLSLAALAVDRRGHPVVTPVEDLLLR